MNTAFAKGLPTLDESIVQRLLAIKKEGEPALFIKVIHLYDIEVNRLYDAIKISFDTKDENLLFESIHSLKSCSGNIGATRLVYLCQDLLEKIKHDKTQFILFQESFSTIEQELEMVKKQIALYAK